MCYAYVYSFVLSFAKKNKKKTALNEDLANYHLCIQIRVKEAVHSEKTNNATRPGNTANESISNIGLPITIYISADTGKFY